MPSLENIYILEDIFTVIIYDNNTFLSLTFPKKALRWVQLSTKENTAKRINCSEHSTEGKCVSSILRRTFFSMGGGGNNAKGDGRESLQKSMRLKSLQPKDLLQLLPC
jgi:hypothetical protein